MAKPDNVHEKYHYFVDRKKYESEKAHVTGAEIRQAASVPANYQLFLEQTGNDPDRMISDAETLDLVKKPLHFFAVPPATFGAA